MPAFSLVYTPQHFTDAASPHTRRSPTQPTTKLLEVTVSAVCLSPATLSARNHLTSGLLRTLSRVAASKPTSWLSQQLQDRKSTRLNSSHVSISYAVFCLNK